MNEEALKTRLKFIAKEKDMMFNQVWKQLLLERFLARLSSSNHSEKFVFKGGLLLANYINIARETMDIDFMLRNLSAQEENIKNTVIEIINAHIEEDVNFKWHKIVPLKQPHMPYPGFRVSLHAQFGKMKEQIQIDIGIGDAVTPKEKVYFPFMYKGQPIFTGEITLLAYPIETIFSEKLESIISRGALNSRMKDYHDLLLMLRELSTLLNKEKLTDSIEATFSQRNTSLKFPIAFDVAGVKNLQKLWSSHLGGLGLYKEKLNFPNTINEAIDIINEKLNFLAGELNVTAQSKPTHPDEMLLKEFLEPNKEASNE